MGGDCFVELLRRQWENGPLILLSGTSDKKVQEGGDKEVCRLGGLDLEEREGPTDPGTNFCAALCGAPPSSLLCNTRLLLYLRSLK